MTLHEELAKANVPGARIRAALIQKGIEAERERIIKLWREFMGDADADQLEELIKGENKKGHNGGEHTPCCNDWGCYGCEDCDCPDCLEEENK